MSPDRRPTRPSRTTKAKVAARLRADPRDPFEVQFFQRHVSDDPGRAIPGREFLASIPVGVATTMRAVVTQVAAAPPHRFAGGGMWEAMHGAMTGIFEVRATGPGRVHHRLFCLLDRDARNVDGTLKGPLLVIVDGDSKPNAQLFPESVYVRVRGRRDEYLKRNPRSLA